jgi:molybdopterin converting factor small subunit
MKKIKILAFATARDVLGFSEKEVECKETESPEALLERIAPKSRAQLKNARVAIDLEYSEWSQPIGKSEVLAVIPPVSGG